MTDDLGRDFAELRESGMLWLINATVFHPRGYALALHLDDDGKATGWSLTGDGTEPWSRADFPGRPTLDDLFAAAERTFAAQRT